MWGIAPTGTYPRQYKKCATCRKKGKNAVDYLTDYVSLDTETSHNHDDDNPQGWIYQWAYTYQNVIYSGRSPVELMEALGSIVDYYGLGAKKRLMIFVHNLPYDFHYLMRFLFKKFGEPDNMLADKPHGVFCVTFPAGLEFRCTYKLSNDSLDRFAAKYNTQHRKKEGFIDYDKIIHQSDNLTRRQWVYQYYDVVSLHEAVAAIMHAHGDDISSLPLTSTGYCRRTFTERYKHGDNAAKNVRLFKNSKLSIPAYNAVRCNMSGGISMGNAHMQDVKQKGTIRHRDFISHYPSRQIVNLFPASKMILYAENVPVDDFLALEDLGFCAIGKVRLKNLRIKPSESFPYLQTEHAQWLKEEGAMIESYSGRVIDLKGATTVYLSTQELKLVMHQYQYDKIEIKEVYRSRAEHLPEWITSTIMDNFEAKCIIKSILSDDHLTEIQRLNYAIDYLKSKNFLNSTYGVSATDPVRQEVKLDLKTLTWYRQERTNKFIADKLDEYYNSFNKCMRYEWGVYTTIYARMELMRMIYTIGIDQTIYCDTDSAFYHSNHDIESKIEAYNVKQRQINDNNGYYVTVDGKKMYLNQFADECENIKEFKFLHSKAYAYTLADGTLKCTIAGVPKRKSEWIDGKEFVTKRENELGNIDNLRDGFIFKKCGGTKTKYVSHEIDTNEFGDVYADAAIITDTSKELNIYDIEKKDKYFEQIRGGE